MQKGLLILVLLAYVTLLSAQKKIAGIWEGKLNAGNISLRMVFHIEKQSEKCYSASMDSPDQGVKDILCDSVIVNGDSIIVILKGSTRLKGLLAGDSTINGNWEQRGMTFPIDLKKVNEVSKNPNRPQTPLPPFTYNSEDIEYDNPDKSIHYGATFTYPKGDGPFPTAILITGSGQQDRDETILGHKPFAVIADYLTKKGYAVLRVDDRGMGKSTGDVINSTSLDFAGDVEVGLAYLKERKEVDKKRMGLIGHSEGGLIADIVAARNKDINFVIMLAGPGVKGSDILVKQNADILKSDSVPDEALKAYEVLYKKIMEDVIAAKDSSTSYNKLWVDFSAWKKSQSHDILTTLNISSDSIGNGVFLKKFEHAFASPWIRYFMQADPQPLIEKFTCKVLALDGSKDLQVNAEINLAAINKALKKSKSPSFETKELPGLNHLFQHCSKCTLDEYATIEETFAPEVLDIIGQWLDKNVKPIK